MSILNLRYRALIILLSSELTSFDSGGTLGPDILATLPGVTLVVDSTVRGQRG